METYKHIRDDGVVEFRNKAYDTLINVSVEDAVPIKIPDEIVAEYERSKYKQSRALEYPTIGDQLDALFKAGVFPPEMAAQIQAVKDKYPKPTE